MGSAEGVIYATLLQDRLKTAIFLDGGYFLDPPPPGGDQADFAPRMKKPVLMVNGRYDYVFSVNLVARPDVQRCLALRQQISSTLYWRRPTM